MTGRALTIEQVLTLLAGTPPRIAALTDSLTPVQLRAAPAEPDEWSANGVLAHLRSCADVWGDCIRTILDEDRPTIRAVDPRTWIRHTDYPDLEFRPSFHAFATQRTELLTILEPLTPDDWARAASLTGAGAPLERTVLSFAQRLARHERTHVRQIDRTVNPVREAATVIPGTSASPAG